MSKFPMGGAFDGIKESDWIFGETVPIEEIPDAPMRFEDTRWEVNQDDIAPNICTICDAWGAVSDVTGYIPTEDDILEIRDIGLNEYEGQYQFDPSVGWYLHLAVDEVRRSANRKGLNLSSLALSVGSPGYLLSKKKGYTVATGHRGNREYNRDRDDDGILSVGGVNDPSTYGHANGHFEYRDKSGSYKRDSYKGRPTNIYENRALQGMIEAGRQFNRGFIFFPKYTMPEITLPEHISSDSVSGDDRNIVIARETEMTLAMNNGHKPIYKDYTSDKAVTRMLIEIAMLRNTHLVR